MKKFLVLLLLLVLLTGCWDREELNDVSIVSGIAIDKGKEEKYKLTVELMNAAELNPQQPGESTPAIVFSSEGPSASEVARRMNIKPSRHLIYSHMRTVVISEEIAKKGLIDFLDFFERSSEIRNDFNIVISKDVPAEDVLKVTYPLQKVSSQKLSIQLNTMVEEWGGDPDVRLNDFIGALISEGREAVLAVVSVEGPVEKGRTIENMKVVTPDAFVKLNEMAVFKGPKLQGYLSLQDTRNYLWTQDKLQQTSLSIPCNGNKYIDIRVYNSNSEIKARYKEGKPTINVDIRVDTYLEATQCEDDLDKIQTYLNYEKLIEEYIEKEITRTITYVQDEYGSDIFGFGEKMFKQDDKNFKKVEGNWNDEFTKAEINVNVNAGLRRTGIRTKSYLSEQ